MPYTNMSYTQGDWTVAQNCVPTPTTTFANGTKSITIDNINYKVDYSTRSDEPAECDIIDVTGSSLTGKGAVRLCFKDVKDIYSNTSLNPVKLGVKSGVQVMVSLEELYRASNAVTGEEGDLPVVGWLCLRMPTHPCSTTTLLKKAMERILGALYATDDATNETLLSNLIRQKLNPTE